MCIPPPPPSENKKIYIFFFGFFTMLEPKITIIFETREKMKIASNSA